MPKEKHTYLRDYKVKNKRTCGQSYKHLTLLYYDSRVIPDLKILHITTLGS